MGVLKEKFSDFVDAMNAKVDECKKELKSIEEESVKNLQLKTEQNIVQRNKIEEGFKSRIEKHESSVLKSKESYNTIVQKSKKSHDSKLNQIKTAKNKEHQSITADFKAEKSKLATELANLEKQYMKDEKKCSSVAEKLLKKADSFNIETTVNRTEKNSQNEIKKIQSTLNESITLDVNYPANIKSLISKLKNIQANIETSKVIHESRVKKLEQRVEKENLIFDYKTGSLEQNKLREELKSRYDLDKICMNYNYNIVHEALKTTEAKIDLDFKMNNDIESFRYYKDTQESHVKRAHNLENEKLSQITIQQKDMVDKVKNNIDLSDKEHVNLYDYENSLNSSKDSLEKANYKLTVEEINVRVKNLLQRYKILTDQLNTSLSSLIKKINENLKIEIKMPQEQIKKLDVKYTQDTSKLAKKRDESIKEVNTKLAVLDPSFDSQEIKNLKVSLEEVKLSYQSDFKSLELTYNKTLVAYQNKIKFANERAEKAINEAKNTHALQMKLYDDEVALVKANAEKEKEAAKKLLDALKTSNDNSLHFLKELNNLGINQNKELVSYISNHSQAIIDSSQSESKNKKADIQKVVEDQINEHSALLKKSEVNHQNTIKELETKLDSYKAMINKKMDVEKKDIQKNISKLDKQLKSSLNEISKSHNKIISSFEVAKKDAETEYAKTNNKLTKEYTVLLNQIIVTADNEGIKIDKDSLDIYYNPEQAKKSVVQESDEDAKKLIKEEPVVKEVVTETAIEVTPEKQAEEPIEQVKVQELDLFETE